MSNVNIRHDICCVGLLALILQLEETRRRMPGSRLRSNKLLNISNIDVWSPNIMNVVDILCYVFYIIVKWAQMVDG